LKNKLSKDYLILIAITSLWCIYALLITPWAYNVEHHLRWLLLSIALIVISVTVNHLIFLRGYRFWSATVNVLMYCWLILNYILYLLWVAGLYHYESGAYSGVMHNRNDFTVQTIFISALYLFFSGSAKSKKIFLLA